MVSWPVSAVGVTATSGTATNAVDGHNDSGWQTLWQSSSALPQSVTIDLGAVYGNLDMLSYLPTQDGSTNGAITGYRVLVSSDGSSFGPVASGTWAATKAIKQVRFGVQTARYVRLEATAAVGGYAAANEILVGGYAARPTSGTTVSPSVVVPSSSGPSPPASQRSSAPPSSSAAGSSGPASSSAGASASGGTGRVTAAYRTVNSWQGGYQGEVTVTAGGAAISGWTVTWALASGQSIGQLWNGTLTTGGTSVTVKNAAWNGNLAANASATFGFLAGGSPSTPTLTVTSP